MTKIYFINCNRLAWFGHLRTMQDHMTVKYMETNDI